MTSWRVFCAVELPEDVRERLQKHIAKLRKQVPEVAASWTRVENMHLTLKFFGNIGVNEIPKISAAATRTVEHFSQFSIEVGGKGGFEWPGRLRVLFIGVSDPSRKFAELQKRFEDECAKEGFEKEVRAYRPHLTIARLRKPEGARQLADAFFQMPFRTREVTLKELVIFRSELSSKGARYTPISHHPLPNPH